MDTNQNNTSYRDYYTTSAEIPKQPQAEKEKDPVKEMDHKLFRFGEGCIVVAGVVFVASLACLGYSVIRNRQMNRMIEEAVGKVGELTPVNISDAIIDKAVTEAIDREVRKAAESASAKALTEISTETVKRVRGAVEGKYGALTRMISDQVAAEASKINHDKLMNDILSSASATAAEKFNEQLDTIIANYNENLGNISAIYQKLADSLSDKVEEVSNAAGGIELKLA